MRPVNVDLGERSYPIYIGEGLLEQVDHLRRHIGGGQVATNDVGRVVHNAVKLAKGADGSIDQALGRIRVGQVVNM